MVVPGTCDGGECAFITLHTAFTLFVHSRLSEGQDDYLCYLTATLAFITGYLCVLQVTSSHTSQAVHAFPGGFNEDLLTTSLLLPPKLVVPARPRPRPARLAGSACKAGRQCMQVTL